MVNWLQMIVFLNVETMLFFCITLNKQYIFLLLFDLHLGIYRKVTEPLYHAFMYSLIILVSINQLLTIYQGVHITYFILNL